MGFWRSVFSDGGSGSFSRVISGFLVINIIGLIDYVTIKTMKIPSTDALAMLPVMLAFYGVNVMGNVASRAVSKPATSERIVTEGDRVQSSKTVTPNDNQPKV